jgi:hypothetical protein
MYKPIIEPVIMVIPQNECVIRTDNTSDNTLTITLSEIQTMNFDILISYLKTNIGKKL